MRNWAANLEAGGTQEAGLRSFVRWAAILAALLMAAALLLWKAYGGSIFFDALAAMQTCL
ncbi:MAG TPA: hypothetical protein VND97_00125 [Beijerinckiaceae bacterium]|nr:hypothetical protein [Beijerinckiaceae bacterium]